MDARHLSELVSLVGGNWQGDHPHGDAHFRYHPSPEPGSELFENHLRNYRPVGGIIGGMARLVLYPSDSRSAAEVLRYCTTHRIKVFSQGGNTGLVGASVPDERGDGIVLSTRRMDRILSPITASSTSVRVEAGVIIDHLNEVARAHGLTCSIRHGGTGSATAGGSVATNSGGANAVRYGVTRDQVVGLRVITPTGQDLVLGGTLKDTSTLIDLKHLFIGSAGSLGVITEVELKLHPLPASSELALVGLPHYPAVHQLLDDLRRSFPGSIEAFEFMDADIFRLSAALTDHGGAVLQGMAGAAFIALVEVSSGRANDPSLQDRLFTALGERDPVLVAMDQGQRDLFWRIREHCNPASKQFCADRGVFFDHCVPVAQVGTSMDAIGALLHQLHPQEMADGRLRMFHFGHCADGNVHTHVVQDAALPDQGFDLRSHAAHIDDRITQLIVERFRGNPAAEHNIGAKTERLRHTDPHVLATVDALKAVLDPAGIMNPGRGSLPR